MLQLQAYGSANIKLVSGKKLTGKVNLYLYNKTTNGSWTQVAKKENVTLTKITTISISANTSKTRYWRVKFTGKVLDSRFYNKNAYSGLLNRKGALYPSHKEVYTGRVPATPTTSLSKNPQSRSKNFRSDYIAWFKKKYPKASVDWSKYEIHHVLPLSYGGSNKMSNGIALTKSQHSDYTTWWANY